MRENLQPPVLADIARRDELRCATALREIAEEYREVGGGIAARGAPGNWINTANGIGLQGPVKAEELAGLAAWWEEKGCEPRIEIAPFADPGVVKALEDLKFSLRSFETVFYRQLSKDEVVRPLYEPPAGLEIRTVDPNDAQDARAFCITAMSGFMPEGQAVPEDYIAVGMRVVRHPRTVCMVAYLKGERIAAGSFEVRGDLTALFGLSVLPPYRRMGVQQTMLAARLNHASARGATLATIGSRPGVATERNVMRLGFRVAYTKVVLCRPGPGLAQVIG